MFIYFLLAKLLNQHLRLDGHGCQRGHTTFHFVKPLEKRLQETMILLGTLDNLVKLPGVVDEFEGDGLPFLVDAIQQGKVFGRLSTSIHGDKLVSTLVDVLEGWSALLNVV